MSASSWSGASGRRRSISTRYVVGLLVLLHVVTLCAGFFAPYTYRRQYRDFPLAPPTPIGFSDVQGNWRAWPLVKPWETNDDGSYRSGAPVPLRFFVRGEAYRLWNLFESDRHLFGVDEQHQVFLLGTDDLGRDYLSRLLYGGQVSLTAGLVGTLMALAIALVLGAAAGYMGGWADAVIMGSADLFLSVPWIYILLAARAFLPLDLSPGPAFLVIVALLGALGWAGPSRLVRSVVVVAKEREFVAAARSAGASHLYVLLRHVLPQTGGVLRTQASILVPLYMLAEVTLSLIGLGMNEPMPSWGNMLAVLRRVGLESAGPALFTPALLMVLVGWLYHLLGRPTGSYSSSETRLRWTLT